MFVPLMIGCVGGFEANKTGPVDGQGDDSAEGSD